MAQVKTELDAHKGALGDPEFRTLRTEYAWLQAQARVVGPG
jgi:hypothetical protein